MKISEIALGAGFTADEFGYERKLPDGGYLSINDSDGELPEDGATHVRVGRYDAQGSAAEGHYQEGTVISVTSLSDWIADNQSSSTKS